LDQGWGWPLNSAKAHYFLKGDIRSICMKWAFGGTRTDDNHKSVDNCKECMKRREKMTAGK
jgi:hypothetical protein